MKNKFLSQVLITSFIFTAVTTSYALNKPTHRLVNSYIAQNSLNGFSLGSYLIGQIGLQAGIDTKFNNKEAWKWIRDGGAFEDEPAYLRSANHFHNPITKQGFTDFNHWWALWGFFGLVNGKSSVEWSLLDNSQWIGGHYSWPDARNYFYNALTATNQATRDQNFADTFKAVGQVMHLVADLSVPEHTRNEFHGQPWNYGYEDYVEKKVERIEDLSSFMTANPPIFFDPSALGNENPLVSGAPIINLFDNNQYHGNNPNVTLQNNIGLSEYTNANFVSPNTTFTSDFTYPNLGSIIEYEENTDGYARIYLRKLGQGETDGGQVGNGEHIEHLAVAGWLYKRLPADQKKLALRPVFGDYAPKLIPRAVGYDAQLLNYFFRGRIDVADSQLTSTSATFRVVNNTPNEAMGPGNLVVAYEYNGNVYGVSSEVQMSETIAAGSESSYQYTVTFSQPIPSSANTKYWLVYRGKLGNEDDAVVAKMLGDSIHGEFGCLDASPNGVFYVPPPNPEGGSFSVDGTGWQPDGFIDFTVTCSYSSGYMSCDLSAWLRVEPGWPRCIRVDHCEGPWDGYSFYDVCTVVNYGCQECDPAYMKFQTGIAPSSSAATANESSGIAPSTSKTNSNASCNMLKRN